MSRGILLFLIILLATLMYSQNTDRLGLRFKLDANISTESPWNYKLGLESRQITHELVHGIEEWRGYRYERTSLTFMGGRDFTSLGNIAAAYMIRQLGDNWVHRGIQQYATSWKTETGKMGFRLRFDETFALHKLPTFRMRYRIGGDIPFSGKQLQSEQWFFSWSHEHMPVLQGDKFVYEVRLVLAMGYHFSDDSKFKTGLEGRWSDMGLNRTEYQLWLRGDYSFNL